MTPKRPPNRATFFNEKLCGRPKKIKKKSTAALESRFGAERYKWRSVLPLLKSRYFFLRKIRIFGLRWGYFWGMVHGGGGAQVGVLSLGKNPKIETKNAENRLIIVKINIFF